MVIALQRSSCFCMNPDKHIQPVSATNSRLREKVHDISVCAAMLHLLHYAKQAQPQQHHVLRN